VKSLATLRDERSARETELTASQGLDLALITQWSAAEIAPIETALLACSTDYQDATIALAASLKALPADDLDTWFRESGWEPVGATKRERVDHYMTEG